MKYYYKSPDQVKKEIEEHIKKNKISSYSSKAIQILFLNIILLVVAFLILDRTGNLKKIYKNKSIPQVQYSITDTLNLHFSLSKTVILIDSWTKPDDERMLQILKIEIYYDRSVYEIYPEFEKTILDPNQNVMRFSFPKNIEPNAIKKIYVIINNQRKEVQAKIQ